MNNKVITIALAALLLTVIGLAIVVFTKAEKVAYIDTGKLLEQSKEMQVLKKQLEKEQFAIKSNVDTLTTEFQEALKKYEKDQVRMSSKEKQLSQELLRSKQQQLIQYQQAIKQKAEGDQQKRTQEIITGINAKIKEYGEQKGYKIIFATAGGNIAYGDKEADITEEIVKLVNQ